MRGSFLIFDLSIKIEILNALLAVSSSNKYLGSYVDGRPLAKGLYVGGLYL